ncbi:hypothetical protein ACWD0Z_19165 [Streptomyces sp. NPDC003007]
MSVATLPEGDWMRGISIKDVQELALPVPATGALPAWKPKPDLVAQVLQQLPDFRP